LEKAVAIGGSLGDYLNYFPSYCPSLSFKSILWALNYEIRKLFKLYVKNSFYCMELLHMLYVEAGQRIFLLLEFKLFIGVLVDYYK
jgi:hypothetical protein